MTGTAGRTPSGGVAEAARGLVRWECRCQQPPVLLGTYDAGGRINIKMRDRYWHIDGIVQTVCPRCGSEHTLDLRVEESRSRGEDGETASRRDGKEQVVSRQS